MSVEAWNARLTDHFEGLRKQRVLSGRNWPIFGLEHGLSSEEIRSLQTDVREHISKFPPSVDHMLPWIVYATEIGYRYEGYEFWQTFEKLTPGWQSYGNRNWIRDCFLRFCNKYGSAKPIGVWADHFTIICWPITNAILPLDLQRHLARILYDLRQQFSKQMLDDPKILGDMVAERSWSANSRFQEFAQNSLLVGQISTALLVQGQDGFESLILPSTLDRIKADLDEVRSARDWLRIASRYAQKVHLEGLSRDSKGPMYGTATTVTHARQQLEEIAIEPRLILQPTEVRSWRLLLEIPDLSQMLVRFPQLRPALTESRCRVAGSSGRWQARGWTVHGSQLISLDEWPKPDEVLLRFERSTSQLDFLLRTECLLRPGEISLFKIASDNRAYQIRSLALRPGNKYIVVNTSSPFQQSTWFLSATLECKDAYASILEMPNAVRPELEQFIHKLGLHLAKSIEVWPAGLTAAKWDGEGYAEWISTERPCIGVGVDHEVKNISLVLDNDQGQALQVVPNEIGEPIFVGFPHLRIGTHKVTVSVQYASSNFKEESGSLEILIRDPQVWRPGTGTRSALTVLFEPRNPTIEQLWENHIDVQILGPQSHKIACKLDFFDAGSAEPILSSTLSPVELPIDTSSWRSYFDRKVRAVRNIADAYDRAYSCRLVLDANELGSFTLQCEREFCALRWMIRYDDLGYALRLFDDTGTLSSPSVRKYEFDKPDKALPQENVAFQKDFVAASNGLYFAQSEESSCAIILPPWDKAFDFATQLDLRTEIAPRVRSPDGIIDIIRFIELWSSARLAGNILCEIRPQRVPEALTRYLFSLMGGKKWAAIEEGRRSSANPLSLEVLAFGVYYKTGCENLHKQLYAISHKLQMMSTSERVSALALVIRPFIRIISVQGRQTTPGVKWLSELALRLASCPEKVSKWAGKDLRWGIDQLLQQPILARAGRSMAIIIEQQAEKNSEESFLDWEWEFR